jgi:DNA-binding NarL/FixJ family response regulator
MSRAISQVPLQVCLVAQNCLVQAYLRRLLQKNRHLHPLSLEQYTRLSPIDRRDTLFVLDECGLEVPLCECLRQLREHCSNAKFILLDDEKSKEEIVRLLVIGAHGYVSHADVQRTLIPAILSVAKNQLWVPEEVLPLFLLEVGRVLRKDIYPRQTTTPRENEILELVRRRLSNREIAELLRIRVSTVKFHLSNILSKVHASNRRELVEPYSARPWKLFPH